MSEETKPPQLSLSEAVRVYFVISKTIANVFEQRVGIFGRLQVINSDNQSTEYLVQKTTKFTGCEEWTLEIMIPQNSILEYNLCLYRPIREILAHDSDTSILNKTPKATNVQYQQRVNLPLFEVSDIPSQDQLINVFHREQCPQRRLYVGTRPLLIGLAYGEEDVNIFEMDSDMTVRRDISNIIIPLSDKKSSNSVLNYSGLKS